MGQFKALSQKNWILWKRSPCGNIIEVLVPIFFIAFIVAVRRLIVVDVYESQSFLTNPNYTAPIFGQRSTAINAGGNTFLKICPNSTIVGLAPSGDAFVSTLNSKLTALGYNT